MRLPRGPVGAPWFQPAIQGPSKGDKPTPAERQMNLVLSGIFSGVRDDQRGIGSSEFSMLILMKFETWWRESSSEAANLSQKMIGCFHYSVAEAMVDGEDNGGGLKAEVTGVVSASSIIKVVVVCKDAKLVLLDGQLESGQRAISLLIYKRVRMVPEMQRTYSRGLATEGH